ncbi:MAG: co-chaperone GroES [Calditrichaeota bacterium]|nr:co-chaperone GroES [Calditrichota bacterium]
MPTNLDRFIVIGDRLLLKPLQANTQTKSGLYLPPSVKEKEKIQSAHVVKAGPGYAVAAQADGENPWETNSNQEVHYIPLQAKEGDLAVFIQNLAHEIEFDDQQYLIVPQSAVLLLIREDA